MGKLNKKYIKSKKRNTQRVKNKKRKTTRRIRVKRGGHEREDVPHYHLNVERPNKLPSIELFVLFAKSAKPREGINENSTQSATIGDLKTAIIDKEWGTRWLMDPDNPAKTKPFTLFWKGKALLNDETKLRDIIVDGKRLTLFIPNNEPIVIVLNEDLEYPKVVETEVIKNKDFEDTPPNE